MYWLGEDLNNFKAIDWEILKPLKRELALTSTDKILDILNDFGEWLKADLKNEEVIQSLVSESGFNRDEVISTLSLVPDLLNRSSLEHRLKAEFGDVKILDSFTKTPHFSGLVKATPLGIILHVTAGNIFLSSIDSLLMGLITKNISLVKVSSQNLFFPLYFARALRKFDTQNILSNKFSILHWKGGDQETESILKSKVNAIVAWGGEEMLSSYKKELPLGIKLLDFGPKVSLQVITVDGLKNKDLKIVAQKLVQDITPWDQAACSSPQNLYLQEGIDESEFLREVDKAFNASSPRGELSDDEATEILKEKYRGYYSAFMEEGIVHSGRDYLIHLEQNRYLRPSPLNRSLIVKRFKDVSDLVTHLEPFSFYLQSGSYLLSNDEKDEYLTELALTGIKRFAPLGFITSGLSGAPHDGRYVLRELTNFIGDERRIELYGEKVSKLQDSQDLKKLFHESAHPPGYIFSSGGTTGEPKYVHFSKEEFDVVTDMLAHNFSLQGVKRGMTVANLFVAGNLWSSFLAVDKALEKIGAIQLPIGGLCSENNIATYLEKFRPQVVMGIPSLLVKLCESMSSEGKSLEIPLLFYAGEALSQTRRDFLKSNWGTKYFGSAGYASVDAGVIGYQCSHCSVGEHHIFSDLVNLDIVNDEGVVTSLYRTTLPIKNYRTGDRMEWAPYGNCKVSDKKIKLLGRIDNVIQIWSARIQFSDIEKSLNELSPGIRTFQVVIKENKTESMEVYFERSGVEITENDFLNALYLNSRDLRDTLSLEELKKLVRLVGVDSGLIPRNPRTGKISLIVDHR